MTRTLRRKMVDVPIALLVSIPNVVEVAEYICHLDVISYYYVSDFTCII